MRKLEIADHQARKEVVEAEGVKKMVFFNESFIRRSMVVDNIVRRSGIFYES